MKTKTITINGKEYKIRYTIRGLFLWEQIMNRPFEVKNLLDTYTLYYAMLLACNGDDAPEWNEFIDALDADPSLTVELAKKINDNTTSKLEKLMEEKGEADENGKKKD